MDNYTVAKAKYEEQYGKGKIGRRLDDCRERYQKACRYFSTETRPCDGVNFKQVQSWSTTTPFALNAALLRCRCGVEIQRPMVVEIKANEKEIDR